MASFAPFQQQPMASTPQDFTLYSNYWDSDRPFISEPMYNDNGLMGYTTTEAYTHAIPNPYALGPDSFEQQYEPRYSSPAKADFSYDYQPPVLSAPTSDSGASHSAMSSNMGSPSAQAQQANEWNPQINMFPSIVQNEHGLQTSGMDIGSLPVLDNSKGCVGELTAVSSFRDMTFSSSNASTPTNEPWAGPETKPYGLHTGRTYQAFNDQLFRESSSASGSVTPTSSADGFSFKSPTTPASFSFSHHPRTPVSERVWRQRRTASYTPSPKCSPGRTRLARSCNAGGDVERMYAPPSPTQSHFFSQSSGHFVPPLGSSCLSPSLRFLFFLSFCHD